MEEEKLRSLVREEIGSRLEEIGSGIERGLKGIEGWLKPREEKKSAKKHIDGEALIVYLLMGIVAMWGIYQIYIIMQSSLFKF